MTEKVKIPQNVADAIEILRNEQMSDYGIITYVDGAADIGGLRGKANVIRMWTYEDSVNNPDKFLSALVSGWDIEQPPYKVGEWVIYKGFEGDVTLKIIAIQYVNARVQFKSMSNWQAILDIYRHATPEEIKVEQERRKWAEIEKGDVLMSTKTGTLAVFIQRYPAHALVAVRIRNGERQDWDEARCELYAKKVGASNA